MNRTRRPNRVTTILAARSRFTAWLGMGVMLFLAGCHAGSPRATPDPNEYASLEDAVAALPPDHLPPIYIVDGTIYRHRDELPVLQDLRYVRLYANFVGCVAEYRINGRCPPIVAIATRRQR